MPKVDWDSVPDNKDFSPLPDGQYCCVLNDIGAGVTRNNDEMWKLKFKVTEGKHSGRLIFDNMIFSEKAMPRVKLIASRLGFKAVGESELTPELIMGSKVMITVFTEDYIDNNDVKKKRNVVPYNGYDKCDGKSDDDDLPF